MRKSNNNRNEESDMDWMDDIEKINAALASPQDSYIAAKIFFTVEWTVDLFIEKGEENGYPIIFEITGRVPFTEVVIHFAAQIFTAMMDVPVLVSLTDDNKFIVELGTWSMDW